MITHRAKIEKHIILGIIVPRGEIIVRVRSQCSRGGQVLYSEGG